MTSLSHHSRWTAGISAPFGVIPGIPYPLVGLTCLAQVNRGSDEPRFAVNQVYVRALEAAGAAPVLIPLVGSESLLRAVYDRLDGLLLPGGGDVDPVEYGQERHPRLGPVDGDRDQVELSLARWALQDDLPTLAICRGPQVLNVAAGGTLYQDVRSQIPGGRDHTLPTGASRDYRAHDIMIVPGSRLAAIVGSEPWAVNSSHHQSVRDLAPGFVAAATAPDGVIEAVEMPSRRFVLGVQFHPEEMQHNDPRAAALFRALVAAAAGGS
jgi:putative glutamine amidotransferase